MRNRPRLQLFVTGDCPSCRRAERVLLSCAELTALVSVEVINAHETETPTEVVSVPTLMFEGDVIGLGTPDCEELVRLLSRRIDDGG